MCYNTIRSTMLFNKKNHNGQIDRLQKRMDIIYSNIAFTIRVKLNHNGIRAGINNFIYVKQ